MLNIRLSHIGAGRYRERTGRAVVKDHENLLDALQEVVAKLVGQRSAVAFPEDTTLTVETVDGLAVLPIHKASLLPGAAWVGSHPKDQVL